MTDQEQPNKKYGFRIDNYFISLPEDGELISENSDGEMYVNVDIFKMDDHNYIRVKHEEVTEDLEMKISAYLGELLTAAAEQAIKDHEQDKSS